MEHSTTGKPEVATGKQTRFISMWDSSQAAGVSSHHDIFPLPELAIQEGEQSRSSPLRPRLQSHCITFATFYLLEVTNQVHIHSQSDDNTTYLIGLLKGLTELILSVRLPVRCVFWPTPILWPQMGVQQFSSDIVYLELASDPTN